MRQKVAFLKVALVVVLIGAMGILPGCMKKEPVKIGFVADLTGKQAELGVQERNGVQLAVEKVNAAGGVAGRPVELVIRDDQGKPETAKAVDKQLIDAGVVAIIGHATSGQTEAGLSVTEPAKMVVVGPTVSSPALTGKYSHFFRVYPSFAASAKGFAQHIYKERKVERLAVLYDTDNAAYAQTYKEVFAEQYQSLGGVLVEAVGFSSAARNHFDTILAALREKQVDGLLLVTSDMDTAIIAQRARLIGWQPSLFASAWAQTEILTKNGGQAVEGMELEQAYVLNHQDPDFLAFTKAYQDRFGKSPSFGAAFGYEAAMVLMSALNKTHGKAEGLRGALLETKNFKVLADAFSFDQNGDVVRPFYLSVIRNNKFVVLGTMTAQGLN